MGLHRANIGVLLLPNNHPYSFIRQDLFALSLSLSPFPHLVLPLIVPSSLVKCYLLLYSNMFSPAVSGDFSGK